MIPCRPRLAEMKPKATKPSGVVQLGSSRRLRVSPVGEPNDRAHSLGDTDFSRVVRSKSSGHSQQSLQERGQDEPLPFLGADPVPYPPQTRAHQESDQRAQSLLIGSLESIRAELGRVERPGDGETQLRDVARLEAAPNVTCLVSASDRLVVRPSSLSARGLNSPRKSGR